MSAISCLFSLPEGENITVSTAAYNGQIYINYLSQLGEPIYPYINLKGQLLPICIDDDSNLDFHAVGGSICQQLGYTEVYNPIDHVR